MGATASTTSMSCSRRRALVATTGIRQSRSSGAATEVTIRHRPISPNGTDTWLVYNAFTTPFRDSAVGPGNDRQLVGVVLHADVGSNGAVGSFSEIHRGASGDARGSSQNDLAAEFLGDYV